MSMPGLPQRGHDFVEQERLIILVDISSATRAMSGMTDLDVAHWLDRYYHLCDRHLGGTGEIIKYMGDACLVLFPPDALAAAIDCLFALHGAFVADRLAPMTDLGVNAHIGNVVVGAFGPQARRDVIGSAVNTTFKLGGGAGMRITERVYRRMPEAMRARWQKFKPPTTYRLDW